MENNLNKNEFDYFIGQAVTDVNAEENQSLVIIFEKGSLIVECPWRLRKNKIIQLGETDCESAPKVFPLNTLKKLLVYKKILKISFHEELIFVITFDDNSSFELFHASNYFEGWNLLGDDGFNLFTLPGGEVSY